MRKVIWCSMGAIACTAAFLAGNYLGQQSRPGPCQAQGPIAEGGISSAEELNGLASLLPDPAKLTAGCEQAAVGPAKQPSVGLLDSTFLQELAPPRGRKITRFVVVGDHEEQEEAELLEPLPEPNVVEERLKRILQSFLEDGKFNGKGRVDTMEFRPSDAKKGEFDRVPF